MTHYSNTDNPIDFPAEMMSDKGYEVTTHEKQAEFARKRCWCHTCRPIDYQDQGSVYMRLCPTCGNKRCPRATDHNLACTNSNEPGQEGSIY
jgi:Zn finger protein HypA/HybF involved in hydrogenase expression